jgi:hypothetical protein
MKFPRAGVRWRHDNAKGSSPDDAALDWSGRTRSARPAKMKQASSVSTFGGPTRPRSPLRRCFKPRPPLEKRSKPVSLPAAGRGAKKGRPSSGGCPATCPDTYRPTRGHRHVRIWAGAHIGRAGENAREDKTRSAPLVFTRIGHRLGFDAVILCRSEISFAALSRDRDPTAAL